jgi:chromosome segregation ATPase
MFFAQLWQTVEVHLSAWRRRWWPLDPVSAARAEANRLTAAIRERKAALAGLNSLLKELREDVAAGQKQAARLTAQVAECVKAGYESQAWPLALDLDELHRRLADVQAELHRHEQVCWSYEFQLRQMQRKLDHVRGQLRRLR